MTKTCPHCHATVLSTSQPNLMGTTPELEKLYMRFSAEADKAAAIEALQNNTYHCFSKTEAISIVKTLYTALAATPAVGGERERIAKTIYEVEPHYESGEYVDGFQVSPGGSLSWEQAVARDAEFGDDPLMGKITEFAFRCADALIAAQPASPLRGIKPEALAALKNYMQADADGVMVYVSRQAGISLRLMKYARMSRLSVCRIKPMTECRHGLSEDCPGCMQETIDALAKALRAIETAKIAQRAFALAQRAPSLSEQQRHAVAHARYQVEHATPENPDCCFDYELVATLIGIIDRASAVTSTVDQGIEKTEGGASCRNR